MPYPSTGFSTFRQEGEPFVISGTECSFTWNGKPTWFKLDCIVNVFKGTGGWPNRNIESVWYVNGVKSGIIRASHMSNQDDQILSGSGWVFLNNGDNLEPMVRNIENSDKILCKNFTVCLWEDDGY